MHLMSGTTQHANNAWVHSSPAQVAAKHGLVMRQAQPYNPLPFIANTPVCTESRSARHARFAGLKSAPQGELMHCCTHSKWFLEQSVVGTWLVYHKQNRHRVCRYCSKCMHLHTFFCTVTDCCTVNFWLGSNSGFK